MAYQKKGYSSWRKGIRQGFDANGGVTCKGCFELRNENAELKEEIVRLRAALNNAQKVTKKDVINAHMPSSRRDYKTNSSEEMRAQRGGAKPGHKGHGRKSVALVSADEVIDVKAEVVCQSCKVETYRKDIRERTIVESVPVVAKKVVYRCERRVCPKCSQVFAAKPPALAKNLYGNSLIAQAAVLHYVHGVPMGRVINIFGENVTLGGLIDGFHRLGRLAQEARQTLVQDYRDSQLKHADETGWRTDGRSGYAWLFCTPRTSIFEFRDTRSSRVAKEILGEERLNGVLVVDRYGGYNQMPIKLQYCYAHLLREVEKLEKEFSDNEEIKDFSSRFCSQLTEAMKLHGMKLSDEEYYKTSKDIYERMQKTINHDYQHLGIKRVQELFIEKHDRMFQWVVNRNIPAENNRAERELRPTVIARKVSFGSQSDAGAKTRSQIMSLLHTARKRLSDRSLEQWLTEALGKIASNPGLSMADLLPQ